MNVYAIDVGGSTLKHGHVQAPTYTQSMNYVRMNVKQHSVQIRRPIERGYVVNWTLEGDIWQENLKLNAEMTLILTTPVFTPEKLLDTQNEVIFEEFDIASYTSVIPQSMLPYHCSKLAFPVCCVIDLGFSSTHIVPIIEGMIQYNGIRRLNVGGKLLTNYLKECVSFRQYNMMDSFELINDLKESICRCSMEFESEMKGYAKHKSPVVQWALPDFVHRHHGCILEPTMEMTSDAQILRIGLESITVPEVLFHPSDIGIDQGGLPEGIVEAISACPSHVQGYMYQRLIVTGGTSKIPNLINRLEIELRSLVPCEYPIEIHHVDDPIGSIWKGCQEFTRTPEFNEKLVTNAEYMEHGNRICREKFK